MAQDPQAFKPRSIDVPPSITQTPAYQQKVQTTKEYLKALGADAYNLRLPETHALPYVVHSGETLQGVVYGRYKQDNGKLVGRGVLVATDQRLFLLDKKPMFVRYDEIIYDAVSGVNYTRVGFMGTVTLHTKIGDIRLRTLNQKCARVFVEAVEHNIFRSPS